ncbi:hypothetical protein, unlikely [Trypanosoma brucei gambiense DAL972]|uniref:Uncharacterized protein n=1 Tax=Trypanosoma brucei gambiense (strain MHOM/CI/86/DAL972) TaxID=679716 RepID=D0A5Z0_TRYB9|nr:hypothetical protein, unlikely [Trypanosoma brucei gambiense DAL972]CBH17091.1 hypothetical protein, unlikely [Trypanosoma brucei gambiense DAL972]|eukprot:XP_011779355.1 hypothetical protein, unlikely [Trypanosoma brucei gambiense DAL972]
MFVGQPPRAYCWFYVTRAPRVLQELSTSPGTFDAFQLLVSSFLGSSFSYTFDSSFSSLNYLPLISPLCFAEPSVVDCPGSLTSNKLLDNTTRYLRHKRPIQIITARVMRPSFQIWR